jgi:predicted aspartyl protease
MRSSFYLIDILIIGAFAVTFSVQPFLPISPLSHKANFSISNPHSLSNLVYEDPESIVDFDSLSIPFKRAGKLLMVETTIDGQTGNLIFDTGASGLVLNRTYFRDYPQTQSVTPSGITGTVGKIFKTLVDSISISSLIYRNVKADIADLGHIENRRGVKVLGLFGFNLLRNFEIIIDIQNNELKLIKIDRKGNRLNGSTRFFKFDYSQEVGEVNNILFVVGEMGGKTLKFCFDTGAEINAISSDSHKLVLNTISITRRSKIGGAGSSTAEVFYGTMNDFEFGNRKLDNMQTIITNLSSLNEAYDVQFGGVLGFDFLEKGVICVNLRKRQLSIRYTKVEEV